MTAATKNDIRVWLEKALERKATHLIVVCDTFDYTDYPVYVSENQEVREIAASYNGRDMQRIMEVYNLKLPIEEQLNQHRVFNY